jgi:poly(3-hydroxybutyrate) depolymerase
MAMRGASLGRTGLALAAFLSARAGAIAADAKIAARTLASSGKTRTYVLYVPASLAADRPAPLLVTLHGSGRDGKSLVSRWQDLAEKEGIVLAGPDSTDSQHWSTPADGPAFLRDVVEDARAVHPIDARRVYLFGHSAGALFALQMACLESEYFAAAAIHAGALLSSQFSIFKYARRKIPIQIAIGDRDEFFPIADARATVDALKASGFPAEIVEMHFHDHEYASSSAKINKTAWEFLSRTALETDPRFAEYRAR